MNVRSIGVFAFLLLPTIALWYVADSRLKRPGRGDDPLASDSQEKRDAAGFTALARLVTHGSRREVEALLDQGADVNAAQPAGYTPLLWAAQMNENPEVIRALVLRGADVNARNQTGQSALQLACWAGRTEAAQVLLAGGADVETRCTAGRTPLIDAARNGSAELVDRLIGAGADPEAVDEEGQTPLMSAVLSDNAETAEALLAAGARTDRVDAQGRMVRELARQLRAERVLGVLGEGT